MMVPPAAMSADAVLIDPVPAAREHLLGAAVATQVQAKPASTGARWSSTVTPKASAGPPFLIVMVNVTGRPAWAKWWSPELEDGGSLDLP
jgi:hypothetical protein